MSAQPARTPREILGIAVLPPGAVTAAANQLRSRLRRVHAAMAPPPARILEGLFGMLDHRVLVALCEARVPEALRGRTGIDALATRLDVDPVMLERLLRFAATRGWVNIDRRGRVRPNRVTAFLRADHPGGWRAWAEFAGSDEVVGAINSLSLLTPDSDGFTEANGAAFFDWMTDHPQQWATFDRAMAAGGRVHALALAAALDWSDTHTVCDVGGGTGDLLATLMDLVPHLRGTVLDLPPVVGRAVTHPRLEVLAGDARIEVPSGFDTYLLVNVLHDWDDNDARRILSRVADAAGRVGRVVVVDSERTATPSHDLAMSSDVLMAALTTGGRERTTNEFVTLGQSVGLRHDRTVRLASGDRAHVYRSAHSPQHPIT